MSLNLKRDYVMILGIAGEFCLSVGRNWGGGSNSSTMPSKCFLNCAEPNRKPKIRVTMWGASMQDHEPPGWRQLSPHGRVHGVSSSEVRRSGTRATEH